MKNKTPIQRLILLVLLLTTVLMPVLASTSASESPATEEKKDFDPGAFIFGHISDSYTWHVTDIGKHSISIPLLVIVRSEERGWFVFSSARFEHGHAAWKGFEIAHEGKYENKVVELLPDGQTVRPLDLSITKNVASLLISAFLLIWIFLGMAKFYKRDPKKVPGGFIGALEVVVVFIQDEVIKPAVGKDYQRYSPYLLTLFFFILINNMLGIVPVFPGGANLTGNIATTGVLAVLSFVVINLFANKEYWREIFLVPTMPSWLRFPIPLMPFLELVSVFTKPMALMIRLFANMLAGHMILMVFMGMIFLFGAISPLMGAGVSVFALFFAIFMSFLELLVVFLQAYVFTMLTAFFIGQSRVEPHEAHETKNEPLAVNE